MNSSNNTTDNTNGARLNRRAIASAASIIGALGIVAALTLFSIQHTINAAVFVAAIIGVLGLSVWLSLFPDDLQNLISRRQALYGGSSIVTSILVVGIVVILFSLANAANFSADLTAYRTYSLRPDISALVKSMKQPAMITAFYTTAQLAVQASDQPILRLFSDASGGLISVRTIDPEQEPIAARNFGVSTYAHTFITGVTADGKPDLGVGKVVTLSNDYVGEQQIADALLLLQARGKFKVLFTTGNGEVSAQSGGEASDLGGGLQKIGMSIDVIDLSKQDIPADTTALVMISPKTDLTSAQVDRITQYMANGGRLLIMAQPLFFVMTNAPVAPLALSFLQDSSPMTQYLWDTWGVRAQNDVVYDPAPQGYIESPYQLLTFKAGNDPIMSKDSSGSAQLQALLFTARSWELTPPAQRPQNVLQSPLIMTSDQAFGAVDVRSAQVDSDKYQRSAKDLAGPFIMAAALHNTKNNSRLIVIGDSQWAQNQVSQEYGNGILWTNMINWLTQYNEKTSVSPTVKPLPLITDTATLDGVKVLTMLLLPGLVLVLGAYVWWDRARR